MLLGYYDQGTEAAQAGKGPAACPYDIVHQPNLYEAWHRGWTHHHKGELSIMDYTLAQGQVYSFGKTDHPPASTLEIEIVTVLEPGNPSGRVTFAVWELTEGTSQRTAQGSVTVPISWLVDTLIAHRAYLLTECTGHVPAY